MKLPALPPDIEKRYRQSNDTTLEVTEALWKTEIGDAKQPDIFYPQVKLQGIENKVNLSIRYQCNNYDNYNISYDGDRIIYTSPEAVLSLYWMTPGKETALFEFEAILNSKPASNVFTFSLQHKGLRAYYQAPLTEQQRIDGAERPPEVDGSYAVYAADFGGMPKAGKLCHLYRPLLVDDAGASVWADLKVDLTTNQMTITAPQDFLDNAVYPVIVDPTIGYSTQGATNAIYGPGSGAYALRQAAQRYTASTGDVVDKIVANIKQFSSDGEVGFNLYTFPSTEPSVRVSPTTTLITASAAVETWDTASVSINLSNGISYCIAMGESSANLRVSYDAGSADSSRQNSDEMSASWAQLTTESQLWSIYATTQNAGSATTVTADAGVLTFLGIAPLAALDGTVLPTAGVVTLTGPTPIPVMEFPVAPSVLTLTFTGLTPSINAGSVGSAPTIGAVTFTGLVPSMQNIWVVDVAGIDFDLVGLAPTLDTNINPSVGTVSFTGLTPEVGGLFSKVAAPSQGVVSFTGLVPGKVEMVQTANPQVGSLTLTGTSPTITILQVNPSPGVLSFTSGLHTVVQQGEVSPQRGQLVFTGNQPGYGATTNVPSPVVIQFTGLEPVTDDDEWVRKSLGRRTWTRAAIR